MQLDPDLMSELKQVGVVPGNEIDVVSVVGVSKPIEVRGSEGSTQVQPSIADAVMVRVK